MEISTKIDNTWHENYLPFQIILLISEILRQKCNANNQRLKKQKPDGMHLSEQKKRKKDESVNDF